LRFFFGNPSPTTRRYMLFNSQWRLPHFAGSGTRAVKLACGHKGPE
jgi:hypothetical protein